MKHMNRNFFNRIGVVSLLGGALLASSCSDFLDPDPQSFFEPEATFSTESGLQSVLAIADRHLKLYYATDHNEMLRMGTEFMFSEMMVAAATDKKDMLCDVAHQLTPTSDDSSQDNLGRTNSMYYMWAEGYQGVTYPNTILQYIDRVEGLDEQTLNEYKGRAYFHRAFRYMHLMFQYGNIPLVTKIPSVPKQNFRSITQDALLQMLRQDMEFAVLWVPEQSEMDYIGMVNKGACRMLLAKIYLALGEWKLAQDQCDILIAQYPLMLNPFGTFNEGNEPQTWPITRNVIWDLHRPENKLIAANTETIMGLPNRGSDDESFVKMLTMRILYPFYFDPKVLAPNGRQALRNIRRNDANYDPQYDYMRAFGRGIATWRPTYWSTHSLWGLYENNDKENGRFLGEDPTDLRHNSAVGNWIRMEDMKYNNHELKTAEADGTVWYGQNLRLFADRDGDGVVDETSTADLLCSDTIRRWYDVPHYKFCLADPVNEANISGSDGLRGATDGGIADWYLYRSAEAYLLRAEAKFYQNPNDPTIADDLNAIRRRAQCTQLYTAPCTIGDIMDERARELYWEEWRNVELKRVSRCLALSGQPDEWGNTYDIDTYDKQSGTDPEGGSYWYQRLVHYSMYNQVEYGNSRPIQIDCTGNTNPTYTMDKKNMYWPIPYSAITANKNGQLFQNYGYDGYDPNIPVWDNWQDAVADEDNAG